MHHTNTTRIGTASKFGRDGTSLRLRRIWYAETNANGQEAQGGTNGNPAADLGLNDGKPWTLESAMVEIEKLREENKKRRVSESEAQIKIREAAEREQKRLADLGQWEQLAKERETQLAALTPYQQRTQELEAILIKSNQQRIAQIPEAMRSLVTTLQLPPEQLAAYLDANWTILQRKPAPETDAGAGQGGGPKQPAVTPEIQSMAGMAKDLGYNISPEALAKRKAEMAQQRRRTPEKDEE